MSSRPQTPSHEIYGSAPAQAEPSALAYRNQQDYAQADFAQGSNPHDNSYLAQSSQRPARFNEEWDASQRGSSYFEGGDVAGNDMRRADSVMSYSGNPSRQGTLKKKPSLSKKSSVKRSGSRRSSRAGSVRSVYLGEKEKYDAAPEEHMSAFYTPIPTTGTPTDVLAHRFQDWRKVLKDLISYFKDIQKSYEIRSKSLMSVAGVVSNMTTPSSFLQSGGIGDATNILGDFHKQSVGAANRAKEIEGEVILQLTGLRSDLQQKIKEIKGLSGDFKNAVDKETEHTRKAVRGLQESLGLVDTDPHATSGKGDPFLIKLGVDRQLEKQIEEENYLHRAYLNLEHSGRELESIVVGEIQKAYNAYAGIIKREADEAYETVEKLRDGPISLPKDHEWIRFVETNEHMVDPRVPIRNVEQVTYPGKDHPAAAEVRAGMLERKSKYLKSYTPGWYVLSPTHLHEFKSADRISTQSPVMSLYLPEQKLGSHSQGESSSHKFMLKGRQTGSMHRGHAWVFRAESHDTMLAWYEDIQNLTEKTGEARNAFVRRHARSFSNASKAGSISSEGGMDEDEADRTPYSANNSVMNAPVPVEQQPTRPQPGGRFPSEIQLDRRDLQAPLSPSSGESVGERDALAAAGALPGSGVPFQSTQDDSYQNTYHDQTTTKYTQPYQDTYHDQTTSYYTQPAAAHPGAEAGAYDQYENAPPGHELNRHESNYGDWLAPAAGGVAGGIAATEAYNKYKQRHPDPEPESQATQESNYLEGTDIAAGAAASQAPMVSHETPAAELAGEASYETQSSSHGREVLTPIVIPTTSTTTETVETTEPKDVQTQPATTETVISAGPSAISETNAAPYSSIAEHEKETSSPTTFEPVIAPVVVPTSEPSSSSNTGSNFTAGTTASSVPPVQEASYMNAKDGESSKSEVRPRYASQDSTFTISDLVRNIPGGYPKTPKA